MAENGDALQNVLIIALFIILTVGVVVLFTQNPLVVASVVKTKSTMSARCNDSGKKIHGAIAGALFKDEDHSYILPPKLRLATLKEVVQAKLVQSTPHILSIDGLAVGEEAPLKDKNGLVVALATITEDGEFPATTKVIRVIKSDGSLNKQNRQQPDPANVNLFPASEPCTVPNDDGAYRAYVIGYKKDMDKALDNEDVTDTSGFYLHAETSYTMPRLGLIGYNTKIFGY